VKIRAFAVSVLLALSVVLAGCPIPIPGGDSAGSRQNISDQTPDFIVSGQTTRAEVVLALGEPDAVTANGVQFLYTRSRSKGGVLFVWVAPGYGGGAGAVPVARMTYRRLAVSFDEAGVVTSARIESASCTELGSRLDPCMSAPANPLSPGLTGVGPSGEPVSGQTFESASWYPGMNGFQFWREARETRKSGWKPQDGGILVVGQTGFSFYAGDADAKSEPLLRQAYADIADVHVARWGMNARVVVKRVDGTHDSFAIVHGIQFDSQTTKRAGELLKTSWRAATSK
jgi:outer membrane protein assembly factor BamE (lipoprotein component of BamABCDE complex)